jgi:hypothetical protein
VEAETVFWLAGKPAKWIDLHDAHFAGMAFVVIRNILAHHDIEPAVFIFSSTSEPAGIFPP